MTSESDRTGGHVEESLQALLNLIERGEITANLPAEKGMLRQIRGAVTALKALGETPDI